MTLKVHIGLSPKSPRIELSNDTFAERKCCRVFAYESETFYCLRPNGISHCENGEQKSQSLPFPLHDVDPHLIQQCLGPPHAPPQTAAPTVEALSHTYAAISPLVTMARPKFAPKSTPSRGPIPHPWTRPTYVAIDLPFFHNALDRPTDRPRESLVTIGRYASNESDAD